MTDVAARQRSHPRARVAHAWLAMVGLLVASMLAAYHSAAVAHVRDARGRIVHTSGSVHRAATTQGSTLAVQDADAHSDECRILASRTVHLATGAVRHAGRAWTTYIAPPPSPSPAPEADFSLYLVAPKTSPPPAA